MVVNFVPSHKNASYLNDPAVWILAKWDLISPEGLETRCLLVSVCILEFDTKEGRHFNKSAVAKCYAFKIILLART